MKVNELKDKTSDELKRMLGDLRSRSLKLNFDLAEGKVKDVSQVKKTRKEIARILTVLRETNK